MPGVVCTKRRAGINTEARILNDTVHITLQPAGVSFDVARGTPLQDILFPYGVEFPCGGIGECNACRVRVLKGSLAVKRDQGGQLSDEEISDGWRLACCCSAGDDVTLELVQWEAEILSDNSRFAFVPRDGFGIAIDLGTTTIAAQLLDLQNANVLAVETALNNQARFGADVMSRIHQAVADGKGTVLRLTIRAQLAGLIAALVDSAHVDCDLVQEIVIVGNTAMHHLFCGLDPVPLSSYPFTPQESGERRFDAADLGWSSVPQAQVRFGTCIGGFVGSDVLAGVRACGLHESQALVGLIDLGTNGEIVLGNKDRLVCCSTAAGPAFEASSLSMGMRAISGAITAVEVLDGSLVCHVAGGVAPRGICGSGIVDAVAAALDLGTVGRSGRIAHGAPHLVLAGPVRMTQQDIREVQVGKAAIAAGLRILLDSLGASVEDLERVYLAGAFGNYINRLSARRIGLLAVPAIRVHPSGNTALLGAKLALFDAVSGIDAELARHVQHIPLSAHPRFQEVFVEEMQFPEE